VDDFSTERIGKLLRQRAATEGLAPGEVFAGRYRIVERLGRGGFGTVYRARHEELGEDVALKVLNPEIAHDEAMEQRFLREVKATKSFVHRHAVQLRDFGRDEERGCLYFTMDLVPGPTLARVLGDEKVLSESRAVALALQVLSVLEAAHAAGIVHRDLKPGNLIVTRSARGEEEVRVLDFGLAKAIAPTDALGSDLTRPGTACGTLAYMSPEQASGRKLDERTDLYSLGAILYEALSGRRPHEVQTDAEDAAQAFLSKLLLDEPTPLLSVAPGVTPAVSQAVMRALAKDPDRRFPTARAFRDALEQKGSDSTVTRAVASSAPAAKTAPTRAMPVFLALAVVLVAGLIAFELLRSAAPLPPVAPPPSPVLAPPPPEPAPPPPPAPLSIELDPPPGEVRYCPILKVHLAGRLSDPAAGPLRVGEEGGVMGERPVGADGRFELDLPIAPNGTTDVRTTVRLVAGRPPREASVSVPVVVDWLYPVLKVTSPAEHETVQGATLVVRGTVADQNPGPTVSITVEAAGGFQASAEAPLAKDGTFVLDGLALPPDPADCTLTVRARDLPGNEAQTKVPFRRAR
jgi:hypothetical protein